MSSSLAVAPRVGAQRPTHLLTPEGQFDFTDGDIAIELAADLGLQLLEWQCWLVRWILAVDVDGRPACSTVVLVVPRQNGKGAVLEAVELFWMLVAGVPKVFHTAHEADTAAGHMERIESMTTEPDIEIGHVHTYKSNGKERTLHIDSEKRKRLLQYRTRTKSTKRGSSPQRIVLDESQELQNAHLAALVPSMAAQSMDVATMPQMIYAGSAPLEHSEYMHEFLERVQRTRPARTLLAMWACNEGVDADDIENWYRVNPSLGVLISESWVRETEFLTMAPDDFKAERLGVPKKPKAVGARGPIDLNVWDTLERQNVDYDRHTATLGVDPSHDRTWCSIGLVGVNDQGFDQLRVVAHRAGTDWAPARVKELHDELGNGSKVAVAKGDPLVAELEALGVPVHEVTSAEFATATSKLIDGLSARVDDETGEPIPAKFRHRGEKDLRKAVEIVKVREGETGKAFSRKLSPDDVSPLTALTLAVSRLGSEVPEKFFAY